MKHNLSKWQCQSAQTDVTSLTSHHTQDGHLITLSGSLIWTLWPTVKWSHIRLDVLTFDIYKVIIFVLCIITLKFPYLYIEFLRLIQLYANFMNINVNIVKTVHKNAYLFTYFTHNTDMWPCTILQYIFHFPVITFIWSTFLPETISCCR